ncbi:hypothetical protein LY622_03610 [Halomonas sp. M5N1S17]|nr:hypothetical protein [Halomonas alkalisoli]MCE9662519.1 hypothetical protein [Halomonas alkalisoli]MCE9681632.1 hypothetical protein [Halomonas alkalisoli]
MKRILEHAAAWLLRVMESHDPQKPQEQHAWCCYRAGRNHPPGDNRRH